MLYYMIFFYVLRRDDFFILPYALFQGTNGHDMFAMSMTEPGTSGDLDIEVILLNKRKVELENQLIRLQMIQVKEKSRWVPT